ncbi:hypothetical protein KY290_012137 [Solanum tuberosum]|uniref:Actin n=1 Tax=Solanum tuberosum TaxID=4113 RepID=A0ABQ7W2P6_SOLTU|nr:hypothetical protein KY290_012137 [Solanum tuberosum]
MRDNWSRLLDWSLIKHDTLSALLLLNIGVCILNGRKRNSAKNLNSGLVIVAVLALIAARELSGIVVHIGIYHTSVVPVRHGEIMHQVGVKATEIGALKVMEFLKKQLEDHNIYYGRYFTDKALREEAMGSSRAANFLHSCKMLCYVAHDYEAELSSEDSKISVASPDGSCVTLSVERFRTGEVLFRPYLARMNAMSLQDAVVSCMKNCQEAKVAADDSWYKTVVLAGGCACMPGLAGRLEKEVLGLLPPPMTSGIRVLPPPYGADSTWFGALSIGNLSTFPTSWCRQRS